MHFSCLGHGPECNTLNCLWVDIRPDLDFIARNAFTFRVSQELSFLGLGLLKLDKPVQSVVTVALINHSKIIEPYVIDCAILE